MAINKKQCQRVKETPIDPAVARDQNDTTKPNPIQEPPTRTNNQDILSVFMNTFPNSVPKATKRTRGGPACDHCRARRIRCIPTAHETCSSCQIDGINCTRSSSKTKRIRVSEESKKAISTEKQDFESLTNPHSTLTSLPQTNNSPSSPIPAFDRPEDTNKNIGYAIPYSVTGCNESSPREEKPFVAVESEFELMCTKAPSDSETEWWSPFLNNQHQKELESFIPSFLDNSSTAAVPEHQAEFRSNSNTILLQNKCPTCKYYLKEFTRRGDRIRHMVTHYKDTLVCGFCPSSLPAMQKSFTKVSSYKEHLSSAHTTGTCSACSVIFPSAQELIDHLDDCILENLAENRK